MARVDNEERISLHGLQGLRIWRADRLGQSPMKKEKERTNKQKTLERHGIASTPGYEKLESTRNLLEGAFLRGREELHYGDGIVSRGDGRPDSRA